MTGESLGARVTVSPFPTLQKIITDSGGIVTVSRPPTLQKASGVFRFSELGQ